MDRSPAAAKQLLFRALQRLGESFGDTESLHLPRTASGAPPPAASRRGWPKWSTAHRRLARPACGRSGGGSGAEFPPVDLAGLPGSDPALRAPLGETGALEPGLVHLFVGLEVDAESRGDALDPQWLAPSGEELHRLAFHAIETALVDAEALRRLAHVG